MNYKEFKEEKDYSNSIIEVKEIIEADKLNTQRRTDENAHKRFFLMWYLRENTTLTFQEIGKLFNRHHSTIIHGIKNHEDYISVNDKLYKRNINNLQEYLKMLNESKQEDEKRN